MAKYECMMCGDIYDEEKEGVKFADLPDDWVCPLCGSPKDCFKLVKEDPSPAAPAPVTEDIPAKSEVTADTSKEQDSLPVRHDGGIMDEIHRMSETARSSGEAMETRMDIPAFDKVLILGGQLARFPLADDADVSLTTVIGKKAAKPMVLESPVYISHMSFGALSGKAKIALSRGAALVKTAMCSGEGGVLHEEMNAAYRYIFELAPNKYSYDDYVLEHSHAVEIKIGQGTKPGMGGHLPGSKVTPAIAALRGKKPGKDILSPSRFPGIDCPEDLKTLVDEIRNRSNGLPIGVKIAAGHIEEDLEFISSSGCDFITIDGRGGATGSSPGYLRDSTSVPTIYALARARKYMDEHGMDQDLIITGGFRTSGDVVKALAMGATAVAMASAPLMALGCQRYRICQTGKCPRGIATQDPALIKRLDEDRGTASVGNYLTALNNEIRTFARITGHDDIHQMSKEDLCTTDRDICEYCGIKHA